MNDLLRLVSCALILSYGGVLSVRAQDGPDYHDKNLSGKGFKGENLNGANFQDAVLKGAMFCRAGLRAANFHDADITDACFDGADLIEADLTGAIINGSTYFEKADLSKAKLAGVDFRGARLLNTILKGADLRNAKGISDLRNADLRQADLRGTNLGSIDDLFRMGGINLKGAIYDSRTRWPRGFDVESSGAKLSEVPAERVPIKPESEPPRAAVKRGGVDAGATTARPPAERDHVVPGRNYRGKDLVDHKFENEPLDGPTAFADRAQTPRTWG